MPIAGRFVTKFNPKILLTIGLLITAYSVFMMATFNLYVDFQTVLWSRFIMGLGLGLVFVPLASMAFATIKKEEMGNATSIFNLLRNIAGSFGIAFMTTLLARRAQFHQFRFVEQLTPSDARYQFAKHHLMSILSQRTGVVNNLSVDGLIYQNLLKQSNYHAFMDAFYAATIIMLCVIPFVFLLKRPKHQTMGPIAH